MHGRIIACSGTIAAQMRVALTGARGFIGSSTLPFLQARGYEVRAIDRASLFQPQSYEGCEAVVHLANIAHATAEPAVLQAVNVEGTRRCAELAASRGVRRFIYLSSARASGASSSDRPFDGTEVPRPEDAYGRSKLDAEKVLFETLSSKGMGALVLRPPLVYGPGVRANFLSLMRAIASGWPLPLASIRNRRSFIYVGNLASAIDAALKAGKPKNKPYPVCDGVTMSTAELCRAIGVALKRPARLFPFPPRWIESLPRFGQLAQSLEVDDRSFRADFGWSPEFSLEEGLRRTAEWYRLECAP